MAAVQQRVLNWLYSVLTSEYQDVNRTYNDVAQALSHYSSLSPKTEVFTYEHGVSALLVHLSGTLPVTFRGMTYRFPISVWIPHAYPTEAPLVYVTPVDGMVIRPGQHVDSQGKVYHPYLVGWAEFRDISNIVDFLAILRDVFANEPPVVSRQSRNNPPRAPQPASIPPPVPPLPPDTGRPSQIPTASPGGVPPPPAPPPKPYSAAGPSHPATQNTLDQRESGPPLPQLPQGVGRPPSHIQSSVLPYPNGHQPYRQSSLRYETAPPLPPPISKETRPLPYSPPNTTTPGSYSSRSYKQTPAGPQTAHPLQNRDAVVNTYPNTYSTTPPGYSTQLPQSPQQRGFQQQQQQQPAPPQPKSKPPPPDLLDAPLTFAPASSQPLVAPPIPPNPEKDILLHNLARALHAQRQHSLSQSSSSLPGLAAQKSSMLSSLNSMQAEITSLESLSSLLSSNTSILHSSLQEADSVISSSKGKPVPEIDGILVAPTVVGNQLYELVCEERALADALFILGRAVERGRVGVRAWVKCTRGLARECFLKKALVKKIGKGMGLAMDSGRKGATGYGR